MQRSTAVFVVGGRTALQDTKDAHGHPLYKHHVHLPTSRGPSGLLACALFQERFSRNPSSPRLVKSLQRSFQELPEALLFPGHQVGPYTCVLLWKLSLKSLQDEACMYTRNSCLGCHSKSVCDLYSSRTQGQGCTQGSKFTTPIKVLNMPQGQGSGHAIIWIVSHWAHFNAARVRATTC